MADERPDAHRARRSRRRSQRATDEDISGAGIDARGRRSRPSISPPCRRPPRSRSPGSRSTRNADFLTLAKARYQVGQATLLDVRQAEVTKGQSDVALLRAVQAENEAKLDLLRRMGVEPPVDGRPDRAHRLVPRHGARPTSSTRCSSWRTSRTRRSARSGRGGPPPRCERALGQERVPADAVRPGRLERVHAAVHRRELPA